MKICPKCKQSNQDPAVFCTSCGAELSQAAQAVSADEIHTEPINSQPFPPPVAPPGPPIQMMAPPMAPPPLIYEAPLPKKEFAWADIFTLIGFISAILGLFWFSVVLFPLGIICSLIGFVGNHTKTLAVAGLTISVIAGVVKAFLLLYNAGLIPEWLTQGLFF